MSAATPSFRPLHFALHALLRAPLVAPAIAAAFAVLLTAGSAHAADPQVRVDGHANLGLPDSEAARFDKAITEAAGRGATDASVKNDASASPVVVVNVKWADDRRIDYVGNIEVQDGDMVLALRGFDCEMCGTDELLVRVQSEVALALGSVTWPAEDEDPAVPAEDGDDTADPIVGPVDPNNDSSTERRPNQKLTTLGWSGVGVAGLGLGATIAGVVLFVREDELDARPDDSRGPVWVKSSRKPGIGLMAGGGAAIAIGATLVVVDILQGRKRNVAVAPALGPRLTGLSVQGRF